MLRYKKYYKLGAIILFFIYIIIVFYFVFLKYRFILDSLRCKTPFSFYWENSVNLKPFRTIKNYLIYNNNLSKSIIFKNIIGNIILFVPFGILCPILITKRKKFLKILGGAFAFSLFIELVQMFFRIGSFDVDDIILNVSGGVIGYFIYLIIRRIWIRV